MMHRMGCCPHQALVDPTFPLESITWGSVLWERRKLPQWVQNQPQTDFGAV